MSDFQHGRRSEGSEGLKAKKFSDAKHSIERRAARKAAQQKAAQRKAEEDRQAQQKEKLEKLAAEEKEAREQARKRAEAADLQQREDLTGQEEPERTGKSKKLISLDDIDDISDIDDMKEIDLMDDIDDIDDIDEINEIDDEEDESLFPEIPAIRQAGKTMEDAAAKMRQAMKQTRIDAAERRKTARQKAVRANADAIALNPIKETESSELELVEVDSDEARLRRIRMQQTQLIPNVAALLNSVENLDSPEETTVPEESAEEVQSSAGNRESNLSPEEAERAEKLRRIHMQQTQTIPDVASLMEEVEDLNQEEESAEEEPVTAEEEAAEEGPMTAEEETSEEESVTIEEETSEEGPVTAEEETTEADSSTVSVKEESAAIAAATAAAVVASAIAATGSPETATADIVEAEPVTETEAAEAETAETGPAPETITTENIAVPETIVTDRIPETEETSAEDQTIKEAAAEDQTIKEPATEDQTIKEPAAEEQTIKESPEEEKTTEIKEGDTNTPEERAAKKKKKGLILRITGGVLLTALVAGYVGTSVYFRSHFYPNSYIGDLDVSCQTEEYVHTEYENLVAAYQLELDAKDGTSQPVKGSEIDLQLDWTDYVPGLLQAQNGFEWPIRFFTTTTYEAKRQVTFDETKLKTMVENLDCMSPEMQVMPVDAHISDYSKDTGFTVVDAAEGTAIDEDILISGIEQAIYSQAETTSIDEMGAYYQPNDVDLDDLQKKADLLTAYCTAEITYEIGTTDTFVLDASTYKDWLILADDGTITLDESKVDDYVKTLEEKYNTYNKSKTLKTAGGSYVTISNVHYGWKINHDKEVSKIMDEIQNGTVESRDLCYSQTAASHGANDYGSSYVAVSISDQHLWLYKKGKLILSTDVVTGCTSKGNGTPKGIWSIRYCTTNATLKGADYETPVSYWMPFNNGIGLHDAWWRSSFGGSIYVNNGSHGCVNLPTSAAKTIYSYVYSGYPVIVY